MNAAIMKIQIFHRIKYDLKGQRRLQKLILSRIILYTMFQNPCSLPFQINYLKHVVACSCSYLLHIPICDTRIQAYYIYSNNIHSEYYSYKIDLLSLEYILYLLIKYYQRIYLKLDCKHSFLSKIFTFSKNLRRKHCIDENKIENRILELGIIILRHNKTCLFQYTTHKQMYNVALCYACQLMF